MSEIKPVIKTAEQRFNEDCEVMNLICVNDINQVPYFKAEVAELSAALEAQTKRANALALVIYDLTKMVTHDAETKDQFIERIKSILSVDPDLRVNKFESVLQQKISKPEHVCNYSPSLLDGSGTMICSCGNWK